MLQQTQSAVVIPFFLRWMETFPTIEALAHAPVEQVLKCWEGLGYYSRARNIHAASQYIAFQLGGKFPAEEAELLKIKGIGSYTQGAIRSFAFKQKAAAIDGNVIRVLSRFYGIEEEVDNFSVQVNLRKYVEALLPDQEPWVVTEALIELGALVCSKKPSCLMCPIRSECVAYRHQIQHLLPKKKPRPQTIFLERVVAVIRYKESYLLKQGEKGKIMADLYEFPFLEGPIEGKVDELFSDALGIKLSYLTPLAIQKHSFTRYRVTLFPHLFEAQGPLTDGLWKKQEELLTLPFSSGHKRILDSLLG